MRCSSHRPRPRPRRSRRTPLRRKSSSRRCRPRSPTACPRRPPVRSTQEGDCRMTTRATRGTRRRTVVALAVILLVLSAFVFRLVDIQVGHADEHVSDSNLGSSRTIAGARGDIVDANGTVMALGTLVYDAQLDPKLIHDYEE